MPRIAVLALGGAFLLLAGPALAQATQGTVAEPGAAPPPPSSAARTARQGVPHRGRTPGPPIDVGPFTPEANRAYMGGGVILEGTPGGPPPEPRALPPETPQRRGAEAPPPTR